MSGSWGICVGGGGGEEFTYTENPNQKMDVYCMYIIIIEYILFMISIIISPSPIRSDTSRYGYVYVYLISESSLIRCKIYADVSTINR